jgi:hypothetical protein
MRLMISLDHLRTELSTNLSMYLGGMPLMAAYVSRCSWTVMVFQMASN